MKRSTMEIQKHLLLCIHRIRFPRNLPISRITYVYIYANTYVFSPELRFCCSYIVVISTAAHRCCTCSRDTYNLHSPIMSTWYLVNIT